MGLNRRKSPACSACLRAPSEAGSFGLGDRFEPSWRSKRSRPMETDALDEFERRLSKTLGPLAATGHRSLLLSAAHAPGLRSTSRYVGLSAALLVVVVLAAARVLGPVGPAGTVATAAGQELRAQRDGDVVRLIVGSPTSVE